MENLKKILESESFIYGYLDSIDGFIPYNKKGCKKINCIYVKENDKVYAV